MKTLYNYTSATSGPPPKIDKQCKLLFINRGTDDPCDCPKCRRPKNIFGIPATEDSQESDCTTYRLRKSTERITNTSDRFEYKWRRFHKLFTRNEGRRNRWKGMDRSWKKFRYTQYK